MEKLYPLIAFFTVSGWLWIIVMTATLYANNHMKCCDCDDDEVTDDAPAPDTTDPFARPRAL